MSEEEVDRDLKLSEIWDALVSVFATVYEVCDEKGVSTGKQLIKLGNKHQITFTESEEYIIGRLDSRLNLVPEYEYDTPEDGWPEYEND